MSFENPFEKPTTEASETKPEKEKSEEEKREMTREQMDKIGPAEFAEVKTFIEGLEEQGIKMKSARGEFNFQQLIDNYIDARDKENPAEYTYLGEIIKYGAGFTKSKEDEAKVLKNLDRLKELLESGKKI